VNPAGVVLAIAGAWVVAQVFAGNALERLNIIKADAGGGGVIADQIIGGARDALPGGASNPPFIDFGKIGQIIGGTG
jgi:hypothetical protein